MTASPAFPFARIVQARQAIKDARTVKRHAWEKEDAALESEQHTLDMILLEHLNAQGATSIATDYGTVYRSLKVRPRAADWSAIWDWIVQDPSRGELMERRLKAAFVKDYMEAHDGALPPGIDVFREYEVAVRKPTTAPSGPSAAQGGE